ncbi:MAG: caspase family protein [Clostridiales bacterium]|nr:caspase family protein [Candidatus Blautia equi]
MKKEKPPVLGKVLRKDLKAIIIGVSRYKYLTDKDGIENANIPNASNDAHALDNFLRFNWHMPAGDILFLPEEMSCVEAVEKITGFLAGLEPKDHLLFYYSGHGVVGDHIVKDANGTVKAGGGKAYITFNDTRVNEENGKLIAENVLPLSHLNQLFQECKAEIKLRFFDCCHCGESFVNLKNAPAQPVTRALKQSPVTTRPTARGLSTLVEKLYSEPKGMSPEQLNEEYAKELDAVWRRHSLLTGIMHPNMCKEILEVEKGWVTICACGLDERAYLTRDWLARRRGLFSYYLVKGLGKYTSNEDETFYIEDLKLYIYDNVLKANERQHVQYQCSLSGNLIL